MPITLHDPPVEEMIRRIGERTGEQPSEVIARAVADLAARTDARPAKGTAEKLASLQAIRRSIPMLTRTDKDAVWAELDLINEELFHDTAGPPGSR